MSKIDEPAISEAKQFDMTEFYEHMEQKLGPECVAWLRARNREAQLRLREERRRLRAMPPAQLSDHRARLEAEQRQCEREERQLDRDIANAWEAAMPLRRLAERLGVKQVLDKPIRERGEYIKPHMWGDDRIPPTIHINISGAYFDEESGLHHGYAAMEAVLAHEIGHHLDYIVNTSSDSEPSKRFLAAFRDAGFIAYPYSQSELMAETFARFLIGHDLDDVLLGEVNKLLAKHSARRVKLIQAYRTKRQKQQAASLATVVVN